MSALSPEINLQLPASPFHHLAITVLVNLRTVYYINFTLISLPHLSYFITL